MTAVLVACDGASWLPAALAALKASTAAPGRVICVDTGSTDGSVELLRAAYGEVLELPRGTGFGAAVAGALEDLPATEWVWLLHDDAAPEPDALEALLAEAVASPSAAVLGPKVRDWSDPRVLVEVGLTTDLAGHRSTGLERREYDQGQHDTVRDVLAVGTAGALVRRAVWDEVGGLDPALPVFRDDLDLGWRVNAAGHRVVVVPAARIRHVRAATTGARALPAAPGRPAGIDRRNALLVLLAHAAGPRLLLVLPRLALACLLRALGFLLSRQPLAARDELLALASVLGHPGRLAAARRARARTRRLPPSALRPLLAARTERLRAGGEAVLGWLSGGAAPSGSGLGALGDPGPEGPDELADLAPGGTGALRRLLLRPGVLLTAALALVALVAERAVLPPRGGVLLGGRLLPVPGGARDLWAAYAAGWHPTAVGSDTAAHPVVAALAAVSTVLLGKPWLAVDLLLLGSIPLAGAAAYAASGRVVRHRLLRLWVAATWALLPVGTGAVAQGRLDVAAAQVAIPPLLVGAAGLLRADRRGWRRAWGLGLGLAFAAAFAPLLWPLLTAAVLLGALAARSPRRLLAAVVVGVTPLLVLLPWSADALRSPARLLDGPGLALTEAPAAPWGLVLLSPGGPGTPATWATAGLVLAAVGALLRRTRRRPVEAGWALALLSLAVAAGLTHRGSWPGIPLQLAAAGLLLAALVGADGLRTRLARRAFGWRQLTAVLVAALAGLAPLLLAGFWAARGAGDPLRRGVQPVLPAFARAELDATPGLRVLVVRAEAGRVGYELTGAGGDRFGTAETPPDRRQLQRLDAVVADLVSPRGSDAAQALATRAVRYVAVTRDRANDQLVAALDVQEGLSRRSSGPVLLWRVVAPASRLTLLPAGTAAAALRGERGPSRDVLRAGRPQLLPSGREAATADLPRGGANRLLVLAEAVDNGWRATVAGRPLPRRTAWGWSQAFVVPAAGGRLALSYDQGPRHRALAAQVGALVVVLVLAAPGGRRRRGLEIVDRDDEDLREDDA